MPPILPTRIAACIAAKNARDADAVAACFTDDAVVRDEGRENRGARAVRLWAEETARRYRPVIEPAAVRQAAGTTVVTARVSGTFPGSPVTLDFAFALRDDRIERLEIR